MAQKDKNRAALELINDRLQIKNELANIYSEEEQFKMLSQYLNDLIEYDFNKLIAILYRIDVSETKVREALATNETHQTGGSILARLLIEREIQKIELRAKYSSKEDKGEDT